MAASRVTQTIRDAMITEKVTDGLALRSDQGSQCTAEAPLDLSKESRFQPSMSSSGCPYDNAAMENFCGWFAQQALMTRGSGQALTSCVQPVIVGI